MSVTTTTNQQHQQTSHHRHHSSLHCTTKYRQAVSQYSTVPLADERASTTFINQSGSRVKPFRSSYNDDDDGDVGDVGDVTCA